MQITTRLHLTVIVVVALCGGKAFAQSAKPTPQHLADWLSGKQQTAKDAALKYILTIPANERGPIVNSALSNELLRLEADMKRRDASVRAGRPDYAPEGVVDYYTGLITAASQSSDPVFIVPLAGVLGSGRAAQRALARFGDQAMSAVLSVARDQTEPDPAQVSGALKVLQMRLTDSNFPPLAPVGVAQAKDIAWLRLRGRQHMVVLGQACELATALNDRPLRDRVQTLATNSVELSAMGIADSEKVRYVQKRASEALKQR